MAWSESFSAVVREDTQVLILGSMPGTKSLEEAQYYAHPRNAFWPIMEALFDIPVSLAYEERLKQLNQNKVGLWDVYAKCFRPGSLDSAIEKSSADINDFSGLFKRFPSIHTVFCNGKESETVFRKKVLSKGEFDSIHVVGLTSTSPANARLAFEQKLVLWQQVKEAVNAD